jgi:uncharacterized protein (DUF362 family)
MPDITSVLSATTVQYPDIPPFSPGMDYPEYPFDDIKKSVTNDVYDKVRDCLRLLTLDIHNFGTKKWNPFGTFINPGDKVVLKPNLIKEGDSQIHWESLVTHGSIIRAVIDYVYIALNGIGEVLICDGPQTDSDMVKIKQYIGIQQMQDLYWNHKKFEIKFVDLRIEYWNEIDGIITSRTKLSGDPKGYKQIDLNGMSFLSSVRNKELQYYGAYYDIEETNRYHNNKQHSYLVALSPLDADVIINLPKLKTHKKVGITLNLKNLVGIAGNKNCLPHYTFNNSNNGDQFPNKTTKNLLENFIVKIAKKDLLKRRSFFRIFSHQLKRYGYHFFGNSKKVIRSGNWYGNDTAWRMCLDLNKILRYGNRYGDITTQPYKRKYLSIIDGIVGMEGDGPLEGTPKYCGLIAAGFDPLAADLVCTKLMGFDYKKIKLLYNALTSEIFSIKNNDYDNIHVVSNDSKFNKKLIDIKLSDTFHFEPHFGWKGHIELEK